MPGDVSRVQSPESDEGMMQANVQNRRRTRLLFQCEQSAFFGTVGAEAAAVSNGVGGASESNPSLGSGLRSTGRSFLSRCFSGAALIGR